MENGKSAHPDFSPSRASPFLLPTEQISRIEVKTRARALPTAYSERHGKDQHHARRQASFEKSPTDSQLCTARDNFLRIHTTTKHNLPIDDVIFQACNKIDARRVPRANRAKIRELREEQGLDRSSYHSEQQKHWGYRRRGASQQHLLCRALWTTRDGLREHV